MFEMVVWVQARLIQSEAPIVLHDGHDFEGERCDIRCLNAVHEKCRCRCGGRNHGYLVKIKNLKLGQHVDYLWLNHIPEIRRFFEDARCLGCGHSLSDSEILGYPHESGIWIEDYQMMLWVFAVCPRCKYQNALNGVVK
ncbi:MAG: hypothetical protein QXG35_09900 [Nitrososphaerota archaeon]